jgi:hypothetical protein
MEAATPPGEEPRDAIVRTTPPAPEPEKPVVPAAVQANGPSDVDVDLDEFVTLRVKLGGERFIARETSLETQKAIVRAVTQAEIDAARERQAADPVGQIFEGKSDDELQARADELGLTVQGSGEDGAVLRKDLIAELTISDPDAIVASLEEARDDTIRNIDSIYPQLREVLTHADGERQGQPPTREFLEQHLRNSTLRKLNKALRPSEDAEGKS